MDEFQLISKYFDRRSAMAGVVEGIGDDAAVLAVESGLLVHALDTLVEDVHFPPGTTAADIAWRAVAVNLSDIAAMGAMPRWMTLGLTLPVAEADWLAQFSQGLFEAAEQFDVALVGGDTTRGPAVVVTIAMTGVLASGSAPPLLRSGAHAGDTIYVTGTLGDAAAGLALYEDGIRDDYLQRRFFRPEPRLETGQALLGVATAAIDVSDGLLGDLTKLLRASDVGGQLDIERLPLSAELLERFDIDRCRNFALLGGDDYELCFTGPPGLDIHGATSIGHVGNGQDLECRIDGKTIELDLSGYTHF